MNKKLIGVLIPVLGGLAIVGSGFSAWYFGETVTGTVSGTGKVTGLVEEGTLNVGPEDGKTISVTLDQKKLFKEGDTTYEADGLGIDVVGNMTETGTANKYFGFAYDAGNTENGLTDADLPYSAINAKVVLANNKNAAGKDYNVTKYIKLKVVDGLTSPTVGEDGSINGGLTLRGESIVELDFEWVTGMKPTNYLEYCQMLNDLSGTEDYTTKKTVDGKEVVEPNKTAAEAGLSGDKKFTFSINVTVTVE